MINMIVLPMKANVPKEWITGNNLAITQIAVPSWSQDKVKYTITMDNSTRVLSCECLGFKYKGVCHHVRGLLWFCYKSRKAKRRGAQSTSAESYYKFSKTELGQRQRQVFDCLKMTGPLSNREIAKRVGLPINSITGRTKELRDMGAVTDNGTIFDAITNRNVLTWTAIGEMEEMK